MNPWFQTVFPGKNTKKHQVSAAAQNALASALGVAPEALSWESQRQQISWDYMEFISHSNRKSPR